jgi:phage baseplate assembly protein V
MIDFLKIVTSLKLKINSILSRAVVSRVDDSSELQELQLDILAGETRSGLERFQNYGFSSVPLSGSEAVALFVGGHRDHGLVVAVDDRRYRPTGLEAGEVAVYHHGGAQILLKNDGSVEINAPKIYIAGSGSSAMLGEEFESLFNSHVHVTPAGTSGPPTILAGAAQLSGKIKIG